MARTQKSGNGSVNSAALPLNTIAVPPSPEREALRGGIAGVAEARQRLDALHDGASRAREKDWEVGDKLSAARAQLDRAETDEPVRLAQGFLAGNSAPISPELVAARETHAAVQAEQQHISQIRRTLDAQIGDCGRQLQRAERAVADAIGQLVAASPEFRDLLERHHRCWVELRGVRKVLALVFSAAGAGIPGSERWLSVESLDWQTTGVEVDDTHFDRWRGALAALHEDAGVPLPAARTD